MPTCRRFAPQNLLLWQSPVTEVHQIFSRRTFFIDGVNATICVEIRPPVVECAGRKLKKEKKIVGKT